MSAQLPYEIGHKVHLLLTTGQISSKRFEIVKVWRYPSTFRYLLDTGYVADHSELRASEGGEPAAPVVPPARPETLATPDTAETEAEDTGESA